MGSLAYLGTYLGTYVPTAVPTPPWYWSGVGTQAGKSLVTSLHLVRYFQSTRAGFRFGSLLWTTSVPRFCKLSIYSQYCILLHVGNLLFLTNAVQRARARHRECTAKSVEPLSSWIAPWRISIQQRMTCSSVRAPPHLLPSRHAAVDLLCSRPYSSIVPAHPKTTSSLSEYKRAR